jgi:hypothetical protein
MEMLHLLLFLLGSAAAIGVSFWGLRQQAYVATKRWIATTDELSAIQEHLKATEAALDATQTELDTWRRTAPIQQYTAGRPYTSAPAGIEPMLARMAVTDPWATKRLSITVGWEERHGKPGLVGLSLAYTYPDLSDAGHILITGATAPVRADLLFLIVAQLCARCAPADLQILILNPHDAAVAVWQQTPFAWKPMASEPKVDGWQALRTITTQREAYLRQAGVVHWNGLPESQRLPQMIVLLPQFDRLLRHTPSMTRWLAMELAGADSLGIIYILTATNLQHTPGDWQRLVTTCIAGQQPTADHMLPNLGMGMAEVTALGAIPLHYLPDPQQMTMRIRCEVMSIYVPSTTRTEQDALFQQFIGKTEVVSAA